MLLVYPISYRSPKSLSIFFLLGTFLLAGRAHTEYRYPTVTFGVIHHLRAACAQQYRRLARVAAAPYDSPLPRNSDTSFDHFPTTQQSVSVDRSLLCVVSLFTVTFFPHLKSPAVLLRGTIVNMTYRKDKNVSGIYLRIFTNNICSYLLWSPVVGG